MKSTRQRPSSNHIFTRIAKTIADFTGRPLAFILAAGTIIVWAVTGPLFGFSDTWQLVINTSTTIITFLMVFLIQNAQNRDTHALQIKLDELIRATQGARNTLLDLEELEDSELCTIQKTYEKMAADARASEATDRPTTAAPRKRAAPARRRSVKN